MAEQYKELNSPFEKSLGNLLYHVATKVKKQITHHEDFLIENIMKKKINTEQKFDAAVNYLMNNPGTIDQKVFDEAAGIGVIVTPEQIEDTVEESIVKHKTELLEMRYRFNIGSLMSEVRNKLKWGDGKAIKNEIDMQILHLLGPKTEEDNAKVAKPKVVKEEEKPTEKKDKPKDQALLENLVSADGSVKSFNEICGDALKFHKPGENYKTDNYVITDKTMDLLKKHMKETGGKVFTRFPPEPNGILHIGHAKAINFNFGFAKAQDGHCYLRYDDTNPEKEEEEFFIAIKEMVEWLGYKPFKITHASDNFQKLYELAKDLIKRGHAYVCHQKPEELKGFNPPASPWRDRPMGESLQLFEDMKNGKIDEGKAILRMKTRLEEGKQDPVAYRIKFCHHARSGEEWCIYPTYDFTHCLCDSIENITHSLCTKEFQARRSSYYWLCNVLDIYCPVQWEYSRLNLNYTVVSKRKIGKLITEGIVKSWDDPRLYTLTALRRRGIPPEAINMFCANLGVTQTLTQLDTSMLDACVRDVLNVTAPRAMAVLEPLKVVISNFPKDHSGLVSVPNFPADPNRGTHTVSMTNIIYIEASDFKEEADKNFKRLTLKQSVGLRHAGLVITINNIKKDKDGNPIELEVSCEKSTEQKKPKCFIQWISKPTVCEVRLYERLFKHAHPEDPNEVPGGFLTDCNKDSLKIVQSAFVDEFAAKAKLYDIYQFERNGFYVADKDSTPSKIVFNLTIRFREDAGKVL